MASQLATKLRACLADSEVVVSLERRGRDPQPGRPDSVLWLRPSTLPVTPVVPILVELEGVGNYHGSKTDVKCFAKRHDPVSRPEDDSFRYHLEFPTVDYAYAESLQGNTVGFDHAAPMTVPVEYDLFTVPSKTMTDERSTTDARLHQALRDRYREAYQRRESPTGFSCDATIQRRNDIEIVVWHVDWRLPGGNTGTIAVPFVVDAGPNLEDILRAAIAPIRIPVMAVIDGSPEERDDSPIYETGVRFPPLAAGSVRTLPETRNS